MTNNLLTSSGNSPNLADTATLPTIGVNSTLDEINEYVAQVSTNPSLTNLAKTNYLLEAAVACKTKANNLINDFYSHLPSNFNYKNATSKDYIDNLDSSMNADAIAKVYNELTPYGTAITNIYNLANTCKTNADTEIKSIKAEIEDTDETDKSKQAELNELNDTLQETQADYTKLSTNFNNIAVIKAEIESIVKVITEINNQLDHTADTMSSIDDLKILNDGALQKLQALENEIMYRQFYFPGCTVKLHIHGKAPSNPPKDVVYDGIEDNKSIFDNDFDPRYLPDYIERAQKNGFYKHFLYYDGNAVKTISFSEAYDLLHVCINTYNATVNTNTAGCSEKVIYGILGGLSFFDKIDCFLDEFGPSLNMSKDDFRKLLIKGDVIVKEGDKQLANVIGQSKDRFVKDNYGWQSHEEKYAFDINEFKNEWNKAQKDLKEYKEKIWEILKNTKALQVCGNSTSGVQAGDVTINQMVQCSMAIEGEKQSTDSGSPSTNSSGNKSGKTPSTPSTPSKPSMTDPTQPSTPTNPTQPSTPNTPDEHKENKDDKKPVNNTLIIIIVVVLVVVLIGVGVGVFLFVRMRNNREHEQLELTGEPLTV